MADLRRRIYEELSPFYVKSRSDDTIFKGINSIGQDKLRYLMQPATGRFSALVQGRPGSGKTRCTLGIVDTIVQLLSTGHKTTRPPIILLTYNIPIFMAELEMNYQHGLINEFEDLYRQMMKNTNDDIEDDHTIGLSYYRMYGYKSFENIIFNGTSAEKDEIFVNRHSSWDDELEHMANDGKISINEDIVRRLDGCVIIADEIREAYAQGFLNRAGLVISYLMQKLRNVSLVISDATPISRVPIEIVPIANMMMSARYTVHDMFEMHNGALMPNKKCFKVMLDIAHNTYVLEQPEISSCPSLIIEGERLNNKKLKKCMNYIRCPLSTYEKSMIEQHCTNKLMRRTAEVAIMWDGKKMLDGRNVNKVMLERLYPNLSTLLKNCCKLRRLHKLLFEQRMLFMPGIFNIYTSLVIPPGTELIKYYLAMVGLDEFEGSRRTTRPDAAFEDLCLICEGPHSAEDHVRLPIVFSCLNRSMAPNNFINTFKMVNDDKNINGHLIKVLIVTTCVSVGVSLRETQRFIMYDQLNSVPIEIQFRGRFHRPGSIKNKLGDNAVHCGQLMTCDDNDESYEIEYAQVVHNNWMAVKPMMEFILSNANIIEYADLGTPETSYIDGPVILKRRNYYTAKQIYEYHKYNIDNSAAVARLAKIKVKPHSDILITSAEMRVSIAGVVVKSLLMIMPTITISQLLNMIKTHPPLMNYNVSNLTEEDFYIYGHLIMQISEKMQMPILDRIATENNDASYFNKLLVLLLKSPMSPWSINGHNKIIKICFVENMFYYIGDNGIVVAPKYRSYVSKNDTMMPIDITIKARTYNYEEHLRHIMVSIDRMHDDEPILNLFMYLPQVILNTLLTMILIGGINDKSSGAQATGPGYKRTSVHVDGASVYANGASVHVDGASVYANGASVYAAGARKKKVPNVESEPREQRKLSTDSEFKGHKRLDEFIKVLEAMLMIVPKARAEKILSRELSGDYPLVYMNKSYVMLINGNTANVDIKSLVLDRPHGDIKLQLNSDKDKLRISVYNNAEPEKSSDKRIQRGNEIYGNNVSAIINRLLIRKSTLGNELASATKQFPSQLKYKEHIIHRLTQLQLENPQMTYIEFLW